MKKKIAVVLASLTLICASGCGAKTENVSRIAQGSSVPETSGGGISSVQSETISVAESRLPEGGLDEKTKGEIESLVELYEFEGVIYITEGGKSVYKLESGSSDAGVAFSIDTPMPVGSVSKEFCAAAVLQLCDSGRLSLGDTLSRFYPDYTAGGEITIGELLSMQSGIPDIENSGVISELTENGEDNIVHIKKWVFSQPLAFGHGSAFEYSNTNFFLLADIVEQVSGKSYSEYLSENIFKPLGMTHSGTLDELDALPEWAGGETYDEVAERKTPGLTRGAGDIVTSASDLDRFTTGLRKGVIIGEETFSEMIKNHAPGDGAYGYGITPDFFGGVGHIGAISPYTSFNFTNTEKELNICVISGAMLPDDVRYFGQDLSDSF